MNSFSFLYTEVLIRPLFNLLVGITDILPTHNMGLAIILVTIIVRLILLPPSLHQVRQMTKNQEKMKAIQQKLKDIQAKHKDDKAKQAEATMQAYKEAGVNPAAGCLPLLIQLPILLALYRVFLGGIGPETFHYLYSFVGQPESLQTVFLQIPLTEPSLLLGVIAGVLQFILMRYASPAAPPPAPNTNEQAAQMMQSMQRNMMYFFPVMTVFIALQLPAALSLYWVASTVLAIIQQYAIKRIFNVSGAMPAV
jgi:YidC/Oxa1 family membrane protein insertase